MSEKISVIGLGYVGLPLAVAFSEHFDVIGFDIDEKRIEDLNQGYDYTREIDEQRLKSSNITFSCNEADINESNFHVVAVPTPVDNSKTPNLNALKGSSELVGRNLKSGDIVVYESTVFPGATEEFCIPILEKQSGLKSGVDFFVGYSPERINPGDKEHTIDKIVKVVSAQTEQSLEKVSQVYSKVVTAGIHKATSIKVAEAAKVIENIQRDVNIALMNELSIIFEKLDIDTYDVLEAAKTKWNFLPFTPGLVGGHCIGVDPYYLTYKAATLGYTPQMILSGRKINDEMGRRMARRVIRNMTRSGLSVGGKTVTLLGITFKENVPDIRNTRAIDIVQELQSFGAKVQVIDPECNPKEVLEEFGIEITPEEKALKSDTVILAVPHKDIREQGWNYISKFLTDDNGEKIIFDIKGSLDKSQSINKNWKHIRL